MTKIRSKICSGEIDLKLDTHHLSKKWLATQRMKIWRRIVVVLSGPKF